MESTSGVTKGHIIVPRGALFSCCGAGRSFDLASFPWGLIARGDTRGGGRKKKTPGMMTTGNVQSFSLQAAALWETRWSIGRSRRR